MCRNGSNRTPLKAENPVAKELRLRVGVQDRRGEGTVHIDLWRVAVSVLSGEQRERKEEFINHNSLSPWGTPAVVSGKRTRDLLTHFM